MQRLRAWGKTLMLGSILVGLLLAFLPFGVRWYTSARYEERIYTVQNTPTKPIAIIFGAQVTRRGYPSTMLADRVRTGVDLYRAGKVEQLLMTGDHATLHYNEPDAMKAFAMDLGVPEAAIVLDYGGLRTYDSCYRAKEIFGVKAAIMVTQDFHLDRALLLCEGLGIEAVGVAADYHRPNGYSSRAMGWSRWREIAATSVAVLDLILRPSPRLGLAMPAHVQD